MATAEKANGELEPSKESFKKAIKLAPGDKFIRDEYKALLDMMDVKHKEWMKEMGGFLNSAKMKKIEDRDNEEALLKEKILKKDFNWD